MRAVATEGSYRGRRAKRASVLVCALVLAAALAAIPAATSSALSQRGHFLAESFGKEGSGAGEMKNPQGVAVNEATGDIYVADRGNARVDRFDSKGKFISAWGIGVINGEKTFQICTTTCQAGRPTKGPGELFEARSIAVDNSGSGPSAGDVYVEVLPFTTTVNGKEVERERGGIMKFKADGTMPAKGAQSTTWSWEGSREEIEEPFGVTVDNAGRMYLYDEEYVVTFNNGDPNKVINQVEAEAEGTEAPGIAVGPDGRLYLGDDLPPAKSGSVEISEFLPTGGEPLRESVYDKNTAGVAFDYAKNDLLLNNIKSVAVLDSDKQLVETLGEGQLTKGTGVAVNSATDHIYAADSATGKILDFAPEAAGAPTFGPASATNTTGSSTELSAGINPHGGSGTTYSFRISTGAVPAAGTPCVSPCVESATLPLGASGFDEVRTAPQKVEGLTPETKYRYRVIAQNQVEGSTLSSGSGEFTFTTPFVVGSTLPDGRAYEQVSPVEKNGSALKPLAKEGAVIQASADGSKITYVGAGAISNSEGNPEPEGTYGPYLTQIFGSWKPSGWSAQNIDPQHDKAEGLIPGKGNGYELFSQGLERSVLETLGSEATEFPPLNGDKNQKRTPYLRGTGPECLTSPAPTSCFLPLVNSGNAVEGYGGQATYVGGNADLTQVVVESGVALTAQPVPSVHNLYKRSSEPGSPLELVSILPNGEPAAEARIGVEPRGANHAVSEDGRRIVFTTATGSGPEHIYVRDTVLKKTVQLDLPQGSFEVPKELFPNTPSFYEHPFYQDASPDGSIIYFSDEWRLTPDSVSRPGQLDLYACRIVEEGGELHCKLTDLTAGSGAEPGALQGVLGVGARESSGGLESASVYYVANGKLAPAAEPSKCKAGAAFLAKENEESEPGQEIEARPFGLLCNLYVSRYDASSETWAVPKLVARLSTEDEPDWVPTLTHRAGQRLDLASLTSRVSPDGEGLAFMSDRNLTGYDTRDVTTGRGAEEVYYYDNAASSLACASCNPSGARPDAIFEQENSGEGIGLMVDRPLRWIDRRLAALVPGWVNWNSGATSKTASAYYQNRYLNNDGRLFFDSVEGLVPQDKNGKMDVYEYEPNGIGGCTPAAETFHEDRGGCVSLISSGTATKESAFLDASESGDDVFFLTDAPLVQQDEDLSFDVYDATICGREGSRPCLPPPAATEPTCVELKTCRPEGEPVSPTFAPPATGTTGASGNTGRKEVLPSTEEKKPTGKSTKPLTRAQKLSKALKSCKKIKKQKKRVACEKAARKKYGAKKAGHKSVHKSSRSGR
jgi:hypothetical protein